MSLAHATRIHDAIQGGFEAPLSDEHYFGLDVGDLLVFNAQMIHRGHYSNTTERKALDL
tara:strand:- start:1341 stop:1517 length:177 start_codon:yes stop_codon:yes gene_type:complete